MLATCSLFYTLPRISYDLLNRARGLPNLPPMTVARKFPGAVALDEKLYIMGGLINYPYGRCTETTFVEYFSFEKKKWFQCAAMLHSRSSFGVSAKNAGKMI